MIAEILLAGIEKGLKSFLTVQPSFRLVDDLIVGFETEPWRENASLPFAMACGNSIYN